VTQIPADAPRSEDGQWWWDGATWQPVTAAATEPASPGAPANAGGAAPGVTHTGAMEVTAGANVGIADIDLSVSDIAAVLIAANVDFGSGGNDPSSPNSREEYA
jgi:hypothetical protein